MKAANMNTENRSVAAVQHALSVIEAHMDKLESAPGEELRMLFSLYASAYGMLMETYDPDQRVREIDALGRILRVLDGIGTALTNADADRQALLFSLMEHENPWVRLQAARTSAKVDPDRAKVVLMALGKRKGIMAAEAYVVSLSLGFEGPLSETMAP